MEPWPVINEDAVVRPVVGEHDEARGHGLLGYAQVREASTVPVSVNEIEDQVLVPGSGGPL